MTMLRLLINLHFSMWSHASVAFPVHIIMGMSIGIVHSHAQALFLFELKATR
jgi:hypothetical protein